MANNKRDPTATSQVPLSGLRVVRGPDWRWDDQDGGEGHAGTVSDVSNSPLIAGAGAGGPSGAGHIKTVVVQWDMGVRNNYRVGHHNAYDVRVIDSAPAGIKHEGVRCSSCVSSEKKRGCEGPKLIWGIRWSCSVCTGGVAESVDLCTPCYMNDRACTDHQFWRIDSPEKAGRGSNGVLVSKRSSSRRILLRGIFPGCRVTRGHDWTWKDQDGGGHGGTARPAPGKILDVQGWGQESGRSVANVSWPLTGITNVYRIGHKGKMDVRVAQGHPAATHGHYYPDHLPVLGKVATVTVSLPSNANNNAKTVFKKDDKVRINVSVEALQVIQEGHGGFNPKMLGFLDRIGRVHRITGKGDVRVEYDLGGDQPAVVGGSTGQSVRWTLHPSCLAKVGGGFAAGQSVRVLSDGDAVRTLQSGHGEWAPAMAQALGHSGKVMAVYGDGDVRVCFTGGYTWTFNPACLSAEDDTIVDLDPHQKTDSYSNNSYVEVLQESVSNSAFDKVIDAGDVVGLKDQLSRRPDLNSSDSPKLLAGYLKAAARGHYSVVQYLTSRFPEMVNMRGSVSESGLAGKSVLHLSAHGGHLDILEMLVDDGGADPMLRDGDGDTGIHCAAYGRQAGSMSALINRGADPNARDAKGATVLHVCVVTGYIEGVKLLANLPSGHLDVNAKDERGDTPLHEAVTAASSEDSEVSRGRAVTEILCSLDSLDLNCANIKGFTALHLAAMKGNSFAVDSILLKDPTLVNRTKECEAGYTPLHLAALNGSLEVTKLLVEKYRADVTAVDKIRKQNALHAAVHQGHASVIEWLLISLAPKSQRHLVTARDRDGETALHVALSREGRPVPTSTDVGITSETCPVISQLYDKARNEGVREPHAMALAAFLIVKGAEVEGVRNDRGHSPGDLISDYVTKSYLQQFYKEQTAEEDHQNRGTPQLPAPPSGETTRPGEASTDDKSAKVTTVECGVCSEVVTPITFMPCGHTVVCLDCSSRMKKCLECKLPIESKVVSQEVAKKDGGKSDQALVNKLTDMEERYKCTICMENNITVVFNCGHASCSKCMETLKSCHMCRKPIESKIKFYC